MSRVPGVIVAIDGPAGSGKSTAARLLAEAEGFVHLNTGALYRAAAFLAEEGGCNPERDPQGAAQIAREMVFHYKLVGGEQRFLVAPKAGSPEQDLTQVLFTATLTQKLRPVVNNEKVREALVEKMRAAAARVLAEGAKGVVLEGRDIGTVVFPDAPVKFYIQADLEERTKRRAQELRAKGETVDEAGLREQIHHRDQIDSSRPVGPLKRADDAILIDTSRLGPAEVLKRLRDEVRAHLKP
ncbi:MAG: (d)CMP kinase [Planctomycetes bacterium]|nr:(d)CMP kinase [Planctomycetota bacterium]